MPTLTHTSVAKRAVNQNHRRSVTDLIECYRRAVLREHSSHKREVAACAISGDFPSAAQNVICIDPPNFVLSLSPYKIRALV